MNRPLDRLRRAIDPRDEPDAVLLGRFAADRDEAAFAQLLRRHGPMVFGVCRRLTGCTPDAEDAFQATFLVLACKPESVRPAGRLGAWLHGVAVRCAKKAAARSRRFRSSVPVPDLPDTSPAPLDSDIRHLLDDAIAGLPAAYRAAVVLCHLEGRTRTEAARQLGWSEGTLSGRLARAVDLLGRRLTARGVTAPAVLATVWSAQAAPAAVPDGLQASTEAAAALAAAGVPAGGMPAAALTRGVLRAMTLKRIPVVGLQLLLAAGVGWALLSAVPTNGQEKPAKAAKPAGWKQAFVLKHDHPLTRVAVGEKLVVSADTNGTMRYWLRATGKMDGELIGNIGPIPTTSVDRLGFTPDGEHLFAIHNGGISVCRFELTNDRRGTGYGGENSHHLDFAPDGSWWFERGGEGNRTLSIRPNHWDDKEAGGKRQDIGFDAEVKLAVGSLDNKLLAVWTADEVMHVYDRTADATRYTIPLKNHPVHAATFSPDGTRLAVVGSDRLLKVFDTATGKPQPGFNGHTGIVFAVAFSPDGKRLLTGGDDATARMWDMATGKQLVTLTGHTDSVTGLAFGPDGKTLATASADKTVKLWTWGE